MAATTAETSTASGNQTEDTKADDTKADEQRQQSRSRRNRTRGGEDRETTRLDEHTDKPSVVVPGDPPFADTMDPNERAVSVEPDKTAAALAGYGTVNAVVPAPEREREAEPEREHRTEKYKTRGPNGQLVDVTRDIETGETKVG